MALPSTCTEGPLKYHAIINRISGVVGVSFLEKGGILPSHRHQEPELYMVIQGSGRMTLNGISTTVRSPSLVHIPGNAQHMWEATEEDNVFIYLFKDGPYENVIYNFDEAKPKDK